MKKSVTLIEILLASALTVLVGLAVYKTLSSGIYLWRSFDRLKPKQEAFSFFEKLSFDLRNRNLGSIQELKGKQNKVSFFVNDPSCHIGDPQALDSFGPANISPIYQVEYEFLSQDNCLNKKVYRINEKTPILESRIMNSVSDVVFYFIVFDPKTEEFKKLDETFGIFPDAIEVNIKNKKDDDPSRVISRVFPLIF